MTKVLYKLLRLLYIWVKPTRLPNMISTNQLITLNLKYGTEAKPLKTVAFAQLVSKSLFLSQKPLSQKQICSQVTQMLGVTKVTNKSVADGIEYLKDEGKILNKNGFLELTTEERKNIESNLLQDQKLMESVLLQHFPNNIDKQTLRDWFIEASTDFFGHFGDELVTSITKNTKVMPKNIHELLKPSVDKHKLSAHAEILEKGFVSFVSCDRDSDSQYFMHLVYAMFAARLVASDLGYDPIAVNEVKGATFALDTNVLFALALEKHKSAKALRAVIGALKKLGSKVVYLESTRDEYSRAVSYVKKITMEVVSYGYPNEILEKSRDPFLKTAIKRGCTEPQHFLDFFATIMSTPDTSEYGFSLLLDADSTIDEVVKHAENDKSMHNKIQSFYQKYGSRLREYHVKSPSSLVHDSTMIHVCEEKRKLHEKYWVLSLDRSLQMYAIDRANPYGIPSVLSLDVLVQVLALNTSSGAVDSNEFAPFLAHMILNECMPQQGAYSITDLKTVSQISDEVKLLPPANIEKIVSYVKKARFDGKSMENSQFQLGFHRLVQVEKANVGEELKQAQDSVEKYKVVLQQEQETGEKVKAALQRKIKKDLHFRYTRDFVLQVFGALLVSVPVAVPIFIFFPKLISEIYVYLATVVPPLVSVLVFVPKSFGSYRSKISEIDSESHTKMLAEVSKM